VILWEEAKAMHFFNLLKACEACEQSLYIQDNIVKKTERIRSFVNGMKMLAGVCLQLFETKVTVPDDTPRTLWIIFCFNQSYLKLVLIHVLKTICTTSEWPL
jgi:hypothetical protein